MGARPQVILNDFNPKARFFRAFYDVGIGVLFFAAMKGTLPLFICTPLDVKHTFATHAEHRQTSTRSSMYLQRMLSTDKPQHTAQSRLS